MFIAEVTPGSVAEKARGIRRGDQIIAINGMDVTMLGQESAAYLVKVLISKHPRNNNFKLIRFACRGLLLPEIEGEILANHQIHKVLIPSQFEFHPKILQIAYQNPIFDTNLSVRPLQYTLPIIKYNMPISYLPPLY